MDFVSKEKRSKIMAGVRSKNTKPEVLVRKILHKMGYRFRIHRNDLPGKPDVCLVKYKTAIFVHGCFWHHHTKCKEGHFPTSNVSFWRAKIERNVERDALSHEALVKQGWNVVTIWECETKSHDDLKRQLIETLSRSNKQS